MNEMKTSKALILLVILAAVLGALVIAGCGGGGSSSSSETATTEEPAEETGAAEAEEEEPAEAEEEPAEAEEEPAEEEETGGAEAGAGGEGKAIFTANCGSCHTLAAAGTSGTVGPNLDELKPSDSTVEHQVINGGGPMPAFGKEEILSAEEVKEVSSYVSSVAGE